MYAISVHQPWAQDIVDGYKSLEYRDWNTCMRGDILICSSVYRGDCNDDRYLYGYALGVVNLVDSDGQAFVLEDPRPIKPFPVTGTRGFFWVDVPPECGYDEAAHRAEAAAKIRQDHNYDIIEHLGVLSTNSKGWSKEFNLVSWDGYAPRYDIRPWAPDHLSAGNGVALTEEEAHVLKGLLAKR